MSVVLVYAPGLERPYPLIPNEKYSVCLGKCNAIFKLVSMAVEAHPETRENRVGPWTRAIVVYDDGEGAEVNPCRSETAAC